MPYAVENIKKKRNCLLQAISPFLTMFSTAQNAALCGNGSIPLQQMHSDLMGQKILFVAEEFLSANKHILNPL